MSGSRRRTKVSWMRAPGDLFCHAYRSANQLAECGMPWVNGQKEDSGPRCRNCKFTLSRNMRG